MGVMALLVYFVILKPAIKNNIEEEKKKKNRH